MPHEYQEGTSRSCAFVEMAINVAAGIKSFTVSNTALIAEFQEDTPNKAATRNRDIGQ